MKRLSRNEIVMVEALYLCIVGRSLPNDVVNGLIQRMCDSDMYMYIYLCWLLYRWYPLYSKYPEHLPKK